MGRSRGRLSASSLTTYLRCPRQWLLAYQVGLQGPTRPSQIVGVVLEDVLCELLMMHPPTMDSYDSLKQWAQSAIPALAKKAHERGAEEWEESLWTEEGTHWNDVLLSSFEQRISDGLSHQRFVVQRKKEERHSNGFPLQSRVILPILLHLVRELS